MSPAPWRLRGRMASGLAVLVPLVITVYVLKALFGFTAGILLPVIDPAVDEWPWVLRAALSTVVLLVGVYLLGELATHVVGRRLLGLGDALLLRVPLVKPIYKTSKQVVAALHGPNTTAFQSVVLIEFPRPGLRSVGFLTSTFNRKDGSVWHSVFVPTTPNPTTGFLQILPADQVTRTDFTVEEAFKMVMSLGALPPERMVDLL